jgi:hypothetical protein
VPDNVGLTNRLLLGWTLYELGRPKSKAAGEGARATLSHKDYPASLELRKLYQVVADPAAAKHHQLRVIDESGEDYLYPEEYFVPVQLPEAAEKAVLRAANLTPAK